MEPEKPEAEEGRGGGGEEDPGEMEEREVANRRNLKYAIFWDSGRERYFYWQQTNFSLNA